MDDNIIYFILVGLVLEFIVFLYYYGKRIKNRLFKSNEIKFVLLVVNKYCRGYINCGRNKTPIIKYTITTGFNYYIETDTLIYLFDSDHSLFACHNKVNDVTYPMDKDVLQTFWIKWNEKEKKKVLVVKQSSELITV